MAVCLKSTLLWTGGAGFAKLGTADVGLTQPSTYAVVLVPDLTTTNISACESVSLSGADYLALKAVSSPPPVTNMNVTADIFVGAALVLCFALGWISGAQR